MRRPYLGLLALWILRLPRPFAVLVAVIIAPSHAAGVTAWCWHLFPQPAFALVPIGLVVSLLVVVAWRRGDDTVAEVGSRPYAVE